jgi:dihydrofolate reductase
MPTLVSKTIVIVYTEVMISIIVAATLNRMIGENNDFPWHLTDDMKHFRKITTGHTVIMGRGNYDHLMLRIGKMLPNRRSIVVTRNPDFTAPDVEVVYSLEEAFALAHADTEEVFVIGGAQIFTSALAYADRVYLTEIDVELEGDAYFPVLDKNEWTEISREEHGKDEKHQYSFRWLVFEKK